MKIWIAASLLAVSSLHANEPRAVSPAEAAAVEAAVAYLDRGPAAIVERSSMSAEEIEARLGPHIGASWELQTIVPALAGKAAVFTVSYPSGIDETVVFEMTPERRIANLRILAEPSPVKPLFEAASVAPVTKINAPNNTTPLLLALFALLLAAGSAFLMRPQRAIARALAGVASLLMIGALVPVASRLLPAQKIVEAKKTEVRKSVKFAPLLELRRAMATTAGQLDISKVPADLKTTAMLWKAQVDLQAMRTADVAKTLRKFPQPSDIPLAEILHGRLAFFENRESESILAYERAISLGPGRDGLWYETAQALSTLGFDERAKEYLARLARIGSRNADVRYSLAAFAAMDDNPDVAEAELRRAWAMRPLLRAQLVRAGVFWDVLRRPSMTKIVPMNTAHEATFASSEMSKRPITLPVSAMSRVSGDYLHIQVGTSELSVPGGAALAPIGTPSVDATAWSRAEDEKALAEVPQVAQLATTSGAYTQPVLRRKIERSVSALATRNRWSDVLQLTNAISPKSEHVPVDLFFQRATALMRTQRNEEAKRLLLELAASPVLQRKKDARAIEQLADMLASMDMHAPAIRLLDRAAQIRPNPMIDERVRQIQMNKLLATGYSTHRSPHFELHFPQEIAEPFAKQIADILEAEQARLQTWVRLPNMRPVVVNILSWQDFRSAYTGSDFILGFYNGKITMPLAGVPEFIPEIVALMTHELCHAMVAQATNDQAPRWFQEGLAQRVEMRRYHANALNMYDDERLLSVALLDAVIGGSPDPEMITEAYIESQTVIRYIEAAHGQQAIAKMIAAYAAGANTEEAIRQISGLSVAAFDEKFRAWGRGSTTVFANAEPVRYDLR